MAVLDPHPSFMAPCVCGELPEVHKVVVINGERKYGPCSAARCANSDQHCTGYRPEVKP